MLYACTQFVDMPIQKMYEFVKKAAICHNCFYFNHRTIDCRKSPCRKCQKRQDSLLHFNSEIKEQETSSSLTSTVLVSYHSQLPAQVVLGTELVEILDRKGQYRPCRALLDSCSQCNCITNRFASFLGLSKKRLDIQLNGVDNLSTKFIYSTSNKVKSRLNRNYTNMSFLIFNEISIQMPSMAINRESFHIPSNIMIADPKFHKPADIDILIGAEFYYELSRSGKIRTPGPSTILQETEFGWIVAGRCTNSRSIQKPPMQALCNLIKFHDLPI